MSWSLQITHGDLAFGSNGLDTVSGASKLTQDLGCAILEPAGTDPLHPSFGSIIDGGIDPQGHHQPGVIGHANDNVASTFVGGEIQRLCRTYQRQQIARNQSDVAIYGKSTLTADEALLAIEDVTIHRNEDHMLVTATLRTGTGTRPLALPFSLT